MTAYKNLTTGEIATAHKIGTNDEGKAIYQAVEGWEPDFAFYCNEDGNWIEGSSPEQWFAFTAYNSQILYGFGTADEADRYCDLLNADREINVYGASELEDTDRIAALNSGNDQSGFTILDELQAAL